jgi:hypothetical protein
MRTGRSDSFAHAVYGLGLDLFASLASPVLETFGEYDQLDRLTSYAMVELAAREIGGGPLASVLFKLVLLALLRRSLTSANIGQDGQTGRFSNGRDFYSSAVRLGKCSTRYWPGGIRSDWSPPELRPVKPLVIMADSVATS